MKACLACVLGVLSTFAAVTTASADGPTKTDVVPALQKGGYVLFIRHPKTHHDGQCQEDQVIDRIDR